jgi:FkbM family methyltransferase
MVNIARRSWGIARRAGRGFQKKLLHIMRPRLLKTVEAQSPLVRLGSDYGGWWIPIGSVQPDWICYCVGVGVDATFDVELYRQAGARVWSFDPTPKAINYISKLDHDRSRMTFLPYGIWDQDTTLEFFAPPHPDAVSHSAFDLHGTGKSFMAPCKRLKTLMTELGHSELHVLKLDVEGAWRPVIEDLVRSGISVKILCVEFDSPTSLSLVRSAVQSLSTMGLRLVRYEKDNYLFLHDTLVKGHSR